MTAQETHPGTGQGISVEEGAVVKSENEVRGPPASPWRDNDVLALQEADLALAAKMHLTNDVRTRDALDRRR
jgi:hypothetical protein